MALEVKFNTILPAGRSNLVTPTQNKTSYMPAKISFARKADFFMPAGNKYLTFEAISKMANNSEVIKFLKEHKIPHHINKRAIIDLRTGHLPSSAKTVNELIDNLSPEIQSQIDRKAVQLAACVHDVAKIMMSIFTKPAGFTLKEREMSKLHPTLGRIMSEGTDLVSNKKVLDLIEYHHQNELGTGYPIFRNGYQCDWNQRILHVADEIDALSRKRSYKDPYNSQETLQILGKEAGKGEIRPEIFNAVVKLLEKRDAEALARRQVGPELIPNGEVVNSQPVYSFCA